MPRTTAEERIVTTIDDHYWSVIKKPVRKRERYMLELTDAAIAKQCNLKESTVRTRRTEMRRKGRLVRVDVRTSDGKRYPCERQKRVRADTIKTETSANPDLSARWTDAYQEGLVEGMTIVDATERACQVVPGVKPPPHLVEHHDVGPERHSAPGYPWDRKR